MKSQKRNHALIAFAIALLTLVLGIGTGYSVFLFLDTKDAQATADVPAKMDDVKPNYDFANDIYHVIFFAQPPRLQSEDHFAFGPDGFTGTYTPGDLSSGYWDEASDNQYGKNTFFKEITVRRALTQNDLNSLPDLYINRVDAHDYPLTFTGWTMNRQLMANFVANTEYPYQGQRDNDYDYFNILDPLESIDTMLPDHTRASNATDTSQTSIDGSRIGDHYVLLYPIYTSGKAYNGATGDKKFIARLLSTEEHRFQYDFNGEHYDKTDKKYNYYFMQDWNSYGDNQDPDKYYYYYTNFRVKKGEIYSLQFALPQFTYDNYSDGWVHLDYSKPDGNSDEGNTFDETPFFSGKDDTPGFINGEGFYNIYVHLTWQYPGIIGFGKHDPQYSDAFKGITETNHALIKNSTFHQIFPVKQAAIWHHADFYVDIKVEKVNDFKLVKGNASPDFTDLSTSPSFAPLPDTETAETGGFYRDYYLSNISLLNGAGGRTDIDNAEGKEVWYQNNFFGIGSLDYPLSGTGTRLTVQANPTISNIADINNNVVLKSQGISFKASDTSLTLMTDQDASPDFLNDYHKGQFLKTSFSEADFDKSNYLYTQANLLLRAHFQTDATAKTSKLVSISLKAAPKKVDPKVNLWFFDKSQFDTWKSQNNAVDANGLLDPDQLVTNYHDNLGLYFETTSGVTRNTPTNLTDIALNSTSPMATGISNLAQLADQYRIYDHLNPDKEISFANPATFSTNAVYLIDSKSN